MLERFVWSSAESLAVRGGDCSNVFDPTIAPNSDLIRCKPLFFGPFCVASWVLCCETLPFFLTRTISNDARKERSTSSYNKSETEPMAGSLVPLLVHQVT